MTEYVSYTAMQYMIRTPLYMHVFVCICLPRSSIFSWMEQYMHVFPVYTGRYCHCDGWILISICQYMEVFSSKIHAYTSISTWTYFQQYIWQYFCMYFLQYIWQYFCIYFQQYFLLYFSCSFTTVTVPSRLLRVRLRRRAVNLRREVPTTAICRAAAQAQADRRIQSDQVCATEQRRPAATCTGAPWLRADVP